jgi:hypothetical protein
MPYPKGPSHYTCQNAIQLTGNINIQRIFDLADSQQTSLVDLFNSQSPAPVSYCSSSTHSVPWQTVLLTQGYSTSSHRYPYRTIVIDLRVGIYIQALWLGPQSNVEQYGVRLNYPGCDVDDIFHSSRSVPGFEGQSAVGGIPLAKVAIRLYLNLYTTSDGRPPSNIKLIIVRVCQWC